MNIDYARQPLHPEFAGFPVRTLQGQALVVDQTQVRSLETSVAKSKLGRPKSINSVNGPGRANDGINEVVVARSNRLDISKRLMRIGIR